MVSPQIVFTAIHAGLRLSRAGYTAYVDSTRNRALKLPLPRAPEQLTVTAALKFFSNDNQQIRAFIADEKNERLRWLLNKLEEGDLPGEMEPEFLQIYTVAFWSTQSVDSDEKLESSIVNAAVN